MVRREQVVLHRGQERTAITLGQKPTWSIIEVIDDCPEAYRNLARISGHCRRAVVDDGDVLDKPGCFERDLVGWSLLRDECDFRDRAQVGRRGGGQPRGIGIAAQSTVFGSKSGQRIKMNLPGRPRWYVTDATAERVFLCVREPSMIRTARLPTSGDVAHWQLPSGGSHPVRLDRSR